MSGVSVNCLKKITFSLLPLSEKLEIVTRGRPTPNIVITGDRDGKPRKYLKHFNHNWYDKIKWLCGCDITNALFCFPCLLFGGDTVWTQNGFTNICKMKEKTGKHQNSRRHMANMISLSLLSQINVTEQVTESSEILKNDKQTKEYREDLLKKIDFLKFTGKFELLLRHGGCEFFSDLENFYSCFDPEFRNNLLLFGKTDETVQNDLLQYMLEVCREQITFEILETNYLSIICEDVSDISENLQTVLLFRYELHGVVHERFWGFLDSDSVYREGLSSCVLKELNKILKKDWSKLIAQTFGGPVKGESQNIQSVYHNAHYVQNIFSNLEQTLKHMTSSVKSVRVFFANLASLDKFFRKSEVRLSSLYKHTNGLQFNSLDVCTVYRIRNKLIECFEDLFTSKVTDKTLQSSLRFLNMLKSENFIFWLEIFNKITLQLELFYQDIQSIDPDEVSQTVQEFCKLISRICNSVSFGSAGGSKILECQEVSNCICEEIKERFAFTGHLTAAKLFNRENFERFSMDFPKLDVKETCRVYPSIIEEKLKMELRVFYSQKKFQSLGLLNILNSLNTESLLGVFSETIKLLRILVTIPMTLTESEECFSKVKKVKAYVRDTVNEEKLTILCMLAIESEMVSKIKNFNERVVKKYCSNGKLKFGLK